MVSIGETAEGYWQVPIINVSAPLQSTSMNFIDVNTRNVG
jgi:hypothetical protein